MASGLPGQAPIASRGERWPTVLASLTVGAAFFALWFWLLPQWLGFRVEIAGSARWRWLAAVPSVIGFAIAMRCVWDFGWTGRGTPAPFVPPQRLVVVGFYRYVRNPMYVGFAAGWIGLWIVFGRAQSARNSGCCGGRLWSAPIRGLLRRADAAQEIRARLRNLSPERAPLVAPPASLAGQVRSHQTIAAAYRLCLRAYFPAASVRDRLFCRSRGRCRSSIAAADASAG